MRRSPLHCLVQQTRLCLQAPLQLTILDDDPTPTLSIQDVSQNENSGTASAIVLLSAASAVTVNYATSNGTATADDYTAISATPLTFSAGQTSKTINTIILNDDR